GLTTEAALHEWWEQVVHPGDAAKLGSAWDLAVLQRTTELAHEVRVRRAADGAYRWFLTVVVPLLGADGTVEQWVGTLTDIDDQKRQKDRLEEMVRDRTAALEEVNTELRAEIEERRRAEELVQATAAEL